MLLLGVLIVCKNPGDRIGLADQFNSLKNDRIWSVFSRLRNLTKREVRRAYTYWKGAYSIDCMP